LLTKIINIVNYNAWQKSCQVVLFALEGYCQILKKLLHLRGEDANPENAIKDPFDFVETQEDFDRERKSALCHAAQD